MVLLTFALSNAAFTVLRLVSWLDTSGKDKARATARTERLEKNMSQQTEVDPVQYSSLYT